MGSLRIDVDVSIKINRSHAICNEDTFFSCYLCKFYFILLLCHTIGVTVHTGIQERGDEDRNKQGI